MNAISLLSTILATTLQSPQMIMIAADASLLLHFLGAFSVASFMVFDRGFIAVAAFGVVGKELADLAGLLGQPSWDDLVWGFGGIGLALLLGSISWALSSNKGVNEG
ncbi:MAG: hypothetical protein AAGA96_09750 [Verrucomicrobiota bacterium]